MAIILSAIVSAGDKEWKVQSIPDYALKDLRMCRMIEQAYIAMSSLFSDLLYTIDASCYILTVVVACAFHGSSYRSHLTPTRDASTKVASLSLATSTST